MKFNKAVYFLTIIILSFTSCKKDDLFKGDNSERERAKLDYEFNYLGSNVGESELQWDGDVSTCDAGSVSTIVNEKVLQRINYFRRIVGLNDNCTLNLSHSYKYQEAALIMKANNKLSHHPTSDWSCWSNDGSRGALLSNLTFAHSSYGVTSLIHDFGTSNTKVGHRRLILKPQLTEYSYGTTDKSFALATGMFGNKNIPEFVAYPPNGYIPRPLVFGRWSFSIPYDVNQSLPKTDFSKAEISMIGPDGEIEIDIVYASCDSKDQSIVWEPKDVIDFKNPSLNNSDVTYNVTISGVENTLKSEYSYEVLIFDPDL